MTERIRERVDRPLSQIMSIGGLVLTLALALGASQQIWYFDWRWLLVSGSVLVLFAVGALGGDRLPMSVLRIGWILIPSLTSLALLSTYFAYHGPSPEHLLSWQAVATPPTLTYLVLWQRRRWAVTWSIVMIALPALSSFLAFGPVLTVGIINTPSLLTGVGMVLLFIAIRDRLFLYRQSEAIAEDQELRRAHAADRAREEGEFARLVHDEVLSSLSVAMHTSGPASMVLRQEAGKALRVLEAGTLHRVAVDDECDGNEFAQLLRAVVLEIDSRCRFEVAVEAHLGAIANVHDAIAHVNTDANADASSHMASLASSARSPVPVLLPPPVAEALLAAAVEALRNSMLHAGAAAAREVRLSMHAGGVRIEICDSGVGFDLTRIDPQRLGVRESILARMRNVANGDAQIDSALGQGTRVVLQWRS